ncbi:MAG TPA: 5-oxoprolinase subunit PxpA [Acidimicrobiales bacterium]|nr:5-oxoprolinase subunit PxpA [Acidimicrobiales bacterium]
MPSVDLNADVGEGTGAGGDDHALLGLVTSASVACGFHAGDPSTMRRTVEEAARRGVVVGAHPSYPDRDGFGRRALDIAPARVAADVLYQVGALDALARAAGTRVRYVKPHGALYHRMADDEACARAVVEAVRDAGDLVLLAPAAPIPLHVARTLGVRVVTEAFADRAYLADARLAPRTTAGAVLTDAGEVARRAVSIAVAGRVTAVDGTEVEVAAGSICVHGDMPGAAALARGVRRALEAAGVVLAPFVT